MESRYSDIQDAQVLLTQGLYTLWVELVFVIFPILLVLKLDGTRADWSWKITLIPYWICASLAALHALAISAIALRCCCCLPGRWRDIADFTMWPAHLAASTAFLAWSLPLCLISLKLDGDVAIPWWPCFLPLWVAPPLGTCLALLLRRSSDRDSVLAMALGASAFGVLFSVLVALRLQWAVRITLAQIFAPCWLLVGLLALLVIGAYIASVPRTVRDYGWRAALLFRLPAGLLGALLGFAPFLYCPLFIWLKLSAVPPVSAWTWAQVSVAYWMILALPGLGGFIFGAAMSVD